MSDFGITRRVPPSVYNGFSFLRLAPAQVESQHERTSRSERSMPLQSPLSTNTGASSGTSSNRETKGTKFEGSNPIAEQRVAILHDQVYRKTMQVHRARKEYGVAAMTW